ncbi:MAG: efflux transporter outer membrane subunit [Chthoniobacterales bacterium]|nr:efflux transporter outer membrane subunit [Chthoniobacterales bacterium]
MRSLTYLTLTISLSLFLLLGCAVGPHYAGVPQDKLPSRFKNAFGFHRHSKETAAQERKPIGPWWEIFHDRILNELEREAYDANQDLRIALARLSEARAQTRVAAADFFPTVNLDPSAERQRTSNTLPFQRGKLIGPNPFGGGSTGSDLVLNNQPLSRTYNLFRFPFDLNWEVDLFGRVRHNVEAAKATVESGEADLENLRLTVTANVAADYFNLRGLDAEVAVLEQTIKTRRDALEIAQERLQAGLTSELDVVRAQSDLAGNEANLISVQRTRGDMENALASLLGRTASSFALPADPHVPEPPHIPAGIPSQLLERRPDVASAERQLAAANARIGVATAAFFPQIKLTGAGGFESADLGLLFQAQSHIWQIGPSITFPIFEGGRNTANLQAARARYEEQVGNYRKQVLVAFQEVETALNDLRTLASEAEAQGRAVAAAQRGLDLSAQQYGKGAVTYVDVLDAQRTLLSDQRSSVQLLGQRAQATVQLIKALGGDWR